MKPMKRRHAWLASAVAVVVLGAAYLLAPDRTLDAGDIDAALPTEQDLPGFIPHDGLTGALSVPSDNDEGRVVLSGTELEAQCQVWRGEGDEWACDGVHGVGMVVLEKSENVFFRVLSNVLAYDDEESAEAAWKALVEGTRKEFKKTSEPEEGSSDLGDQSVKFESRGVTVLPVRVGTVVMEITVWDGSDQVSAEEERAMVEKWPPMQIEKVEELIGW